MFEIIRDISEALQCKAVKTVKTHQIIPGMGSPQLAHQL